LTLNVVRQCETKLGGEKYWKVLKTNIKYTRIIKDQFLICCGSELKLKGYTEIKTISNIYKDMFSP